MPTAIVSPSDLALLQVRTRVRVRGGETDVEEEARPWIDRFVSYAKDWWSIARLAKQMRDLPEVARR